MGKILYVNLSRDSIFEKEMDWIAAREYIGGRGLAARFLYDKFDPKVDPLDEKNLLLFVTAPLNGTKLPSTHRMVIATRSPLTGSYMVSSLGGFLGPQVKYCGYDMIIVTGKAPEPSYLWVSDQDCDLRSAEHFWGKMTGETIQRIREETDSKAEVACIGPAGEKLVRIASIKCGSRDAGRGGAGAVMGSKNLKALAFKGTKKVDYADPKNVDQLNRTIRDSISKNKFLMNDLKKYGTSTIVDSINEIGIFPTKNFTKGTFAGTKNINATAFDKFRIKHTCCFNCPICCGKITRVAEGPYKGHTVEGPEYETTYAFGPLLENDSPEVIIAANELCDEYGLDTISTGVIIAFAMEAGERKLLDTNARFGNGDSILRMVRKIGERKGEGDILAEGVKRASEKIRAGSEAFAMHVKGFELPGYDPRGAIGQGLAYAIGSRGACHNKAWTVGAEVFSGTDLDVRSGTLVKYDRFSPNGKAELVKDITDRRALWDSAGVCQFARRIIAVSEKAETTENIYYETLEAITGFDYSEGELLSIGERVSNVERLLNIRFGLSRNDDTLPKRFLAESIQNGPVKGHSIRQKDLDQMVNEYYIARGWGKNGIPTVEKIKQLSISAPGHLFVSV